MKPITKLHNKTEIPPNATITTIDGRTCYLSGIRLEHLQRYPYTITAFNIYRVVGSCEVFEIKQ